jgi:hypothetical protein
MLRQEVLTQTADLRQAWPQPLADLPLKDWTLE